VVDLSCVLTDGVRRLEWRRRAEEGPPGVIDMCAVLRQPAGPLPACQRSAGPAQVPLPRRPGRRARELTERQGPSLFVSGAVSHIGCTRAQLEEARAEAEKHVGKHWEHHNCKTEMDILKAQCAAPPPAGPLGGAPAPPSSARIPCPRGAPARGAPADPLVPRGRRCPGGGLAPSRGCRCRLRSARRARDSAGQHACPPAGGATPCLRL